MLALVVSFLTAPTLGCSSNLLDTLADSAFTASSEISSASNIKPSKSGFWVPDGNDTDTFVQVKFDLVLPNLHLFFFRKYLIRVDPECL